jgi:hypothetical protein
MEKNKKGKSDQVDLKQYQDPAGVTLPRLNFGLWLIKNKRNFFRLLVGILITISAVSLLYSGYSYLDYFLKGRAQDEANLLALTTENTDTNANRIDRSAKDISFGAVEVIKNSSGYDFVVQVENSNTKYIGRFDYCFIVNGQESPCQPTVIFPKEKKYIFSLANLYDYYPEQVEAEIKNMAWQRVNAKLYPDWPAFAASRLDFKFENQNFVPADDTGLSNKVDLGVLEFRVSNKTAYNYWQAPLNLIILQGNQVIGVNRYILTEFKSGETRDIRIVWPGLHQAGEISIVPDIDIVDDSVYMGF